MKEAVVAANMAVSKKLNKPTVAVVAVDMADNMAVSKKLNKPLMTVMAVIIL